MPHRNKEAAQLKGGLVTAALWLQVEMCCAAGHWSVSESFFSRAPVCVP